MNFWKSEYMPHDNTLQLALAKYTEEGWERLPGDDETNDARLMLVLVGMSELQRNGGNHDIYRKRHEVFLELTKRRLARPESLTQEEKEFLTCYSFLFDERWSVFYESDLKSCFDRLKFYLANNGAPPCADEDLLSHRYLERCQDEFLKPSAIHTKH